MSNQAYDKLIHVVTEFAEPLTDDLAPILNKIGDARFVLIGEATHGTHEFYQIREAITLELMKQKGFMAVAIEGDWPDAYHIHRYIQGKGNKDEPEKALKDFNRFPIWMWRNKTLLPFLKNLRSYNDTLTNKIGFYGLDIYSLNASTTAVIKYLETIDQDAAKRAKERYACFNHHADPQKYGYLTSVGIKEPCIKEAVEQLLELQHQAFEFVKNDRDQDEEYFFAVQNARVVKNAEKYYRNMFESHISSWNIRDQHMMETINVIANHLENRFKSPAKIVIWAHNSHVGDARATDMGERGELNIGQLVREQYDKDTYTIGFSTYQGSVTAASEWDTPALCKKVRPGLSGSYEELFHHIPYAKFSLDLHQKNLIHYLQIPRLYRAIGVIYRPETERESHYFLTRLPYQFDLIIHVDETHAIEPLEINPEWQYQPSYQESH